MIVLKWRIDDETNAVEVPWLETARVVLVAPQFPTDAVPTLWVEYPSLTDDEATTVQDPINRLPTRTFSIAPTGMHYEGEWVGTAVCLNGALVWHVIYDPKV